MCYFVNIISLGSIYKFITVLLLDNLSPITSVNYRLSITEINIFGINDIIYLNFKAAEINFKE